MKEKANGEIDTVRILGSVYNTHNIISRFMYSEIVKRKSMPTRAALLGILLQSGGRMTPKKLSERLYRSPSTVTAVVNTLVKEGLVEKDKSTRDGRAKPISLTKKGRQVAQRFEGIFRDLSRVILNSLSVEEMKNLHAIHTKIEEDLLQHTGMPASWKIR